MRGTSDHIRGEKANSRRHTHTHITPQQERWKEIPKASNFQYGNDAIQLAEVSSKANLEGLVPRLPSRTSRTDAPVKFLRTSLGEG